MRIKFDIPDGTRCVFFCYLEGRANGLNMGCTLIDSDDIEKGDVIKIPKEKKKNED